MKRYRWVNGLRKGRWALTKETAQDAAVKAGLAFRDPYNGRIYLDALTRIESED